MFYVSWNQKKAGVAILTSGQRDFKTKTVIKNKEGHYIIIKGSIQQEDIFINVCAPNIGVPTYMKQILMDIKEEIAIQ